MAGQRSQCRFSLKTLFGLVLSCGCILVCFVYLVSPSLTERYIVARLARKGRIEVMRRQVPIIPWLSFWPGVSRVIYLDASDIGVTNEWHNDIRHLDKITTLVLGGRSFGGDALAAFQPPSSLRTLVLNCAAIPPEHIRLFRLRYPSIVVVQSDQLAIEAVPQNGRVKTKGSEGCDRCDPALKKFCDRVTSVFQDTYPTLGPSYPLGELWRLNACAELERIVLINPQLTDRHLRHFSELKQLRRLDISRSEVTDVSDLRLCPLQHLRVDDCKLFGGSGLHLLSQLKILEAMRSNLGDAAILELIELRSLRELDLRGTHVTDASVVHLSRMMSLTKLGLPEGIAGQSELRLRESLPDCKVYR